MEGAERGESGRLPGTLLVSKLSSRGFVGDRRVVFWDAKQPQETQRYNYHLWVEAPEILILDTLTRSLRRAGVADQVSSPAQRVRADYILSGTLYRMEQRIDGDSTSVLIDIELGLVKAASKEMLLLERYVISEDATDNQIPSAVQAFERALSKLTSEYLADLSQVDWRKGSAEK
jgi:ABC-type uncharacterized transport system auxiliary subunit